MQEQERSERPWLLGQLEAQRRAAAFEPAAVEFPRTSFAATQRARRPAPRYLKLRVRVRLELYFPVAATSWWRVPASEWARHSEPVLFREFQAQMVVALRLVSVSFLELREQQMRVAIRPVAELPPDFQPVTELS